MIGITNFSSISIKLIEHYGIKPLYEKHFFDFNKNKIRNKSKYLLLTFDVEEDWLPYQYVGGFNSLKPTINMANIFSKMDIKGTFFITPNVVLNEPNKVSQLKNMGHEIGMHLHSHDLKEIIYPFKEKKSLYLNKLDKSFVKNLIFQSKDLFEDVLGDNLLSFRSGNLASNGFIENVCSECGFQNISNYSYNFKLNNGLYNIDSGIYDICYHGNNPSGLYNVSKLIFKLSDVLVLSGHPMFLYDPRHKKDYIVSLNTISSFLLHLYENTKFNATNLSTFISDIRRK